MDKKNLLDSIAKERPQEAVQNDMELRENLDYINLSRDIALSVLYILKKKGISKVQFSEMMNVSATQVTKWLSGKENLTLKSICKMQKVLEQDLIVAKQCYKSKKSVSVYVHNNDVFLQNPCSEMFYSIFSRNTVSNCPIFTNKKRASA